MKTIGLCALSNGLSRNEETRVRELESFLSLHDIRCIESPFLYQRENLISAADPMVRAESVNDLFQDPCVDAVMDVSGGDLANETLDYLDFDAIQKSHALFWGYSDLSTVINSIYTRTGKPSVLFQIRNLIKDTSGMQKERFLELLHHTDTNGETPEDALRESELFQVTWEQLSGVHPVEDLLRNLPMIGGNIRCFTKLAGTSYLPNFDGKLLFLESLGGDAPKIATLFAQLSQMQAFADCEGVLLGTFTEMERNPLSPSPATLIRPYLPEGKLLAVTREVGHAGTSKALLIGGHK